MKWALPYRLDLGDMESGGTLHGSGQLQMDYCLVYNIDGLLMRWEWGPQNEVTLRGRSRVASQTSIPEHSEALECDSVDQAPNQLQ